MVMEISVQQHVEGTLTRLTIVAGCADDRNEGYSNEYNIDGLAKVKFHVKQDSDYPRFAQCMILVKKNIPTDCTYKVKVIAESVHLEKLYNNSNTEDLSITTISLYHDHQCRIYFMNNDLFIYVFLFNVTISITKWEPMINEKLYNDTDFTDFRLSTTEGSVAVHRALLASHSEVFKTMLSQEWKETAEGGVQVEGVTLKTLQDLKQYMYLGTLPDEGLLPLLSIASCYLMETLKTECISKITDQVKAEELYNLLEYSIENKIPELAFALMRVPGRIVGKAEIINAEKNKKVKQDQKEE